MAFCVFIFVLFHKKKLGDEQWEDPLVKKEQVEAIIVKIYSGARTNPRFHYKYEFKNNSYTNSTNFPKDLWNHSNDSLFTY
ncbi:hypothetical protein [Zhouia amylolytica]|nr:hypothetical protein [Zhouia amylolytica]